MAREEGPGAATQGGVVDCKITIGRVLLHVHTFLRTSTNHVHMSEAPHHVIQVPLDLEGGRDEQELVGG